MEGLEMGGLEGLEMGEAKTGESKMGELETGESEMEDFRSLTRMCWKLGKYAYPGEYLFEVFEELTRLQKEEGVEEARAARVPELVEVKSEGETEERGPGSGSGYPRFRPWAVYLSRKPPPARKQKVQEEKPLRP